MKDLEYIARHYGLAIQENKLIEELGELLVAISKDLASKTFKDCGNKVSDEVIEEMTDVKVLITQIEILADCGKQVDEMMGKKVERQLDRIRSEDIKFYKS